MLAALLFATPAGAAEITRQDDVITIRGIIEAQDDEKFRVFIGPQVVVLDSKGGNAMAAMSIGRFIRYRKLETRVHDGAICNSACPLMWMAGIVRHLDRRGLLGFHTASIQEASGIRVRYERGNDLMDAYMVGMGAPPQVIDLLHTTDPYSMKYINYEQAKAWGLLNPRPTDQQVVR